MVFIFCDSRSSSSQLCSIQKPARGLAIYHHIVRRPVIRKRQENTVCSLWSGLPRPSETAVPGTRLLYSHPLLTNLNRVLMKWEGLSAYSEWFDFRSVAKEDTGSF
ncbi:hypothetical protein AVEN_43711-1 [Araneus ventricosus]|uniref:Uncharacterized protein n=1 Tax=Araneus ventricosus TaxID=182803 RepID=A0A4Y2BW20_ARAVE|nr:hypothetical protein AVEN_43711-1 [Araneus ventricosus]